MTDEKRKLVEPEILRRAVVDSFIKLNPRTLMKNPVMFVVGVGSVLTTILFFKDLGSSSSDENVFAGLVALFLWFTVLFANFAEAVAEGRGKAQADTLAQDALGDGRPPARAGRLHRGGARAPRSTSATSASSTAGEVIPSDGEVIEGIASVDESAITGESAPVIRESGGDRSAVTGGTRVLSDEIVVRITARPGETFIDRMIALVEGSERQKTPERDRAQHPARRPHDHLPARDRDAPAVRDLRERRAERHRAGRAARVPDPDDDRRAALGDRHRGHGPPRAAQRAGDERPRGRGGGRLRHAAARQDRHDHLRQPPGRRLPPRRRRERAGARRRRAALEPRRRDARGSLDRRAGQGPLRPARARARRRRARRRSPRRPA